MYSSDSPAEFCRTSPSNSSTSFMVPEGPLFHRTKIRCSTTKNMESERLKSDVAQGNITSPSNSPRSNHSSVNNSQDYNYIPLNGGRNRSKWSPGYGKRSWTPESLKRDSPFHGFSPRRERLYYPSPRGNMRFNQVIYMQCIFNIA